MRNYQLNSKTIIIPEKKKPFMPIGGPSSAEEAIARIEESENDIAKGRGYALEDVIMEAKKRARRYESAIY